MERLPLSVRGRFKRSVDLVRDFHDTPDITGYIVTPTAKKVLGQIVDALREDIPERAWTLTGPYGGGKSAFALFASHLFRGSADAHAHLDEADKDLAAALASLTDAPFCPVLVGGSRKPLNLALVQGLCEGLEAFCKATDTDAPGVQAVADKAAVEVAEQETTADTVLTLFKEAAEAVHARSGGGLYVVIDELGKLLEYAALHPDRGDIFVLQQLAEHAARTANSTNAPLLLTTILHQAFERYANHLDRTQREEWQKVQGRFEDIAYVEPADTTLRLIAEAIEVNDEEHVQEHYADVIAGVMSEADFPKRYDLSETKDLLTEALPLHPLVGLLVGPLFRRLAQNERSLFAFLSSGEPHGFIDVISRGFEASGQRQLPLYRLDHLYDYLMTTLGATLFSQGTSKLWAETEAALGRLQEVTAWSEPVLKQIAILNFAGELAGLSATTGLLRTSVGAPAKVVDQELERLVNERVVVHRKYNDTYTIWQGSDVDIEAEIERARANVSPEIPLADLLGEVVPPTPVAAHRHSYETGTTRVFEVAYAAADSWQATLEDVSEEADGYIIYVLPERKEKRAELLRSLAKASDDSMTFFAVPDGVGSLHDAVYELKCLDWVGKHVDELRGDKPARRELRERRADVEQHVNRQLNRLLEADEQGTNPCQWLSNGETFRVTGRRELQAHLSEACDQTYTQTPEIWNELLNHRQPSPSAVRGQKKLIEAMVIGNEEEGRAPNRERLGIDGTPAEYGLYASIVRATGMHREADDSSWYFCPPYEDDKPGCYAVWQRIEDLFGQANGKPVPLNRFFEELPRRPYGVRQGLIPVFLFAYFKANEDEIAIYENGSFLQKLEFGTIERLLKTPSNFEMQLVTISDAREDLLRSLAPLVGLPEDERKPLPFVLKLLQQVRGLPPFVRKTSRMSDEAMAVREALYRATDPTSLLFEELPKACDVGIASFLNANKVRPGHIERFVQRLQHALREITSAYEKLIQDVQRRIATAFELRGQTIDEQRHELAERARQLEPHVTEKDVKAFVIRATNEVMDTQAWYESLASALSDRPPVKWLDEDLKTFKTELRRIARKFRTREPLIFESTDESGDGAATTEEVSLPLQRIRLGITMLGEAEQETVVHVHPEDEQLIKETTDRLQGLLESHEEMRDKEITIQLAALARVIQRLEKERATTLDAE